MNEPKKVDDMWLTDIIIIIKEIMSHVILFSS